MYVHELGVVVDEAAPVPDRYGQTLHTHPIGVGLLSVT